MTNTVLFELTLVLLPFDVVEQSCLFLRCPSHCQREPTARTLTGRQAGASCVPPEGLPPTSPTPSGWIKPCTRGFCCSALSGLLPCWHPRQSHTVHKSLQGSTFHHVCITCHVISHACPGALALQVESCMRASDRQQVEKVMGKS